MIGASNENNHLVGIDSEIVDSFICAFGRSERERLIEIYEDIGEYIEDRFNGLSMGEAMSVAGCSYQEVFDEMEKIIPVYVPLLRASMDNYGDEMHIEESEAERLFAGLPSDPLFVPKILIGDGTKSFSYLQIAARKAGIKDENLRFWYLFLTFFVGLSLQEQEH